MAKINPKLLDAIMRKTGLSKRQIYVRIQKAASDGYLARNLAAIKVGADLRVNINKFATADELKELRRTGSTETPSLGSGPKESFIRQNKMIPRKTGGNRASKATPNQVFVVHGRDKIARDSMFHFLRAVGVKPIEWNTAISMTKQASPYIGDIVQSAFANARAVVVLLTPDDLAQLREDLITTNDPPQEKMLTGQARPNVLFEAGMAFSSHPGRTLLVQIGTLRQFSDTAGRHIVHMSNESTKRQELATKLQNAGCDVDLTGEDWHSAGDFTDPVTRTPARKKRSHD